MIYDNLVSILCTQYGYDKKEISMDTNITEDLDLDSVDMVDLLMMVEDEYHIELSDDVMESITTIGDLVSYIESAI